MLGHLHATYDLPRALEMSGDGLPASITTFIPTYRRPTLLARAIRSVLNQTYREFDLFIYDNASGDDTAAVVQDFVSRDPRVHYHQHEHNIGAIANFSYGLERVATPFFSMLSDDDVLLPRFYETALHALQGHSVAMLAALQVLHVDPRGRILEVQGASWRPGLHGPGEALLEILEHGHPTWTGVLFRREIVGTVGPLDEQTGNASDLDFELRAAGLCPIVLCREPGAVFLTHAGGASFGPRLGDTIPTWLRIIKKIAAEERIPKPVRTQVAGELGHRLDQRLFTIAVGAARRGNLEEASRAAALLAERPSGQRASRVASAIVALCASVPPARALVGLLVAFRQWRQRTRWRATQVMFDREFGALVRVPAPVSL
jgi:glycosyltransferase involved in cell wall biosynthesis